MGTKRSPDLFVLVILLLTGAIVVAVYSGAGMRMPGMASMGRHHEGMMGGLPADYANEQNPLTGTEAVLQDGKKLYQLYCAVCHGDRGYGDGPTARNLVPPPANLSRLMRMPLARDDYLFWAISEGGKAFNSTMPAFKQSLSEKERWEIIHYLRRL